MSQSLHPLDNKLLLGRYRVMRLLGEGGMGTVHLARVEGAEGFTRPVVVKRMKRDIRATDEGNRLFIREAKILSRLQHPGIVGISDFGIEDGAHIMVLEYVHGYTLAPWLDYRHARNLPLPVDVCLFITRRILDALHYAHHFDDEQGQEIEIVHRDVAPDNVLLSNKGYVHLLDFGVASMRGADGGSTKSGAFRGKLCYAAPETVQGEQATPLSDQYSAAVLLLELLVGERPFIADSIAQTFLLMVTQAPDLPSKTRDDIPPGLDDTLARALSKDPLARFESALAFSRELRKLQQEDDEEVAQHLKELVRKDFDVLPAEVGVEALKEREAALQKILSIAPPSSAAPRHELPTINEDEPSASSATAPAVVTAAAPSKQLYGLLWAVLAVLLVIALGLGAAVGLLSRGGGEQVVVVGGDRTETSQDDSSVGSSLALPTTGPKVDVVDEQVSPQPPSAQTVNAPQKSTAGGSQSGTAKANDTAGEDGKTTQQKLSAAVARKSGALQSCFKQHLDDTNRYPQATLHFSVAAAGGPAQVKVQPSSLAATPLGNCLQGAASQVQFPKLEKPVAFSVPVRARASRSKGN